MVEIHRDVLEQFIHCDKDASYDHGFALAVLVSVVPPIEMARGKISQDAMDFAIGII